MNTQKKTRPLTARVNPSRPFSAVKYQTSNIQIDFNSNTNQEKIVKEPVIKKDPLQEKNTQNFIEFPVNYRIAHPKKSNYLISLEFWQETNKNSKNLVKWDRSGRPLTANEKPFLRGLSLPKAIEEPLPEQLLQIGAQTLNNNIAYQKLNFENQKPFGFLSSLAGKKTSFEQLMTQKTEEVQKVGVEEGFEDLTKAIQQFSKLDMDKSFRSQIKRQNSAKNRPITAMSSKPNVLQISGQFRVGSHMTQHVEKRVSSGLPLVKTVGQENKEKELGIKPKQRPMTALNNEQKKSKPQENRIVSAKKRVLSGDIKPTKQRISSARQNFIQNQIFEKNMDLFEEDLDIREDFEENDEFYEKAEALQGFTLKSRPKSNLLKSRPISGRSAAPEQFFNMFTKYAKFNDIELPYEELFDRNERTIAATYAKFGDLGYYSPVQRIGAYMQFSSKLKREHLIEIINLQKTSTFITLNPLIFIFSSFVAFPSRSLSQ